MSVSLVQRKSNHSLSGTTVAATFAANVTAGNGLLAAVTWIDPNSNSTPYPAVTVADSVGPWRLLFEERVPLGGDILVGVFFVPYCAAGPNGAVIATSTAPGMMFISLHEIAPNAGEIFVFDSSGGTWGIGFASTFSDTTDMVRVFQPPVNNVTSYQFCAFATRTGNIGPTGTGVGITAPTLREFEINTTPVGTFGVLGSQATLDRISNEYGTYYGAMTMAWSEPSAIVAAVEVIIASVTPVADPPTGGGSGEFFGPQTVTLTQDQGLDIRYTVDGSTPTGSSTLYTGPLTIAAPTTLKAIATQPATGWPAGYWAASSVVSWSYDVYTGIVSNPNRIIDGDDSSFAELFCAGAAGDCVAVRVDTMAGTTGAPGQLKIDYEVTQNDLVAPSQTVPAWKVVGLLAGVESLLASGAVGAGPVARTIAALTVAPGTLASHLAAKVEAICAVPGSSGGVRVRVYAAYLELT